MSKNELAVVVDALHSAAGASRSFEFAGPLNDPVYDFYLPQRPDLTPLLDPEHLPAVTRFETVVLMPGLAEIRWVPSTAFVDAFRHNVGPIPEHWLHIISGVAKRKTGYDRATGLDERRDYLKVMRDAMNLYRDKTDGFAGQFIVPVRRAGANIARELGLDLSLAIEAKRLRIKNAPDLLAVGVNLPEGFEDSVTGRDMPLALIEGFLASGSTVAGTIMAVQNRGIQVPEVNCYAVVGCPAGAKYLEGFRKSTRANGHLGTGGDDFAVIGSGELNKDWYVVYGYDDPLFSAYPSLQELQLIPGDQIGGDAGELTTL